MYTVEVLKLLGKCIKMFFCSYSLKNVRTRSRLPLPPTCISTMKDDQCLPLAIATYMYFDYGK